MAVSKTGMMDVKLAGEDLSAKLFYAVMLDTSNTLVLAGNGDNAYGIVFEAAASGDPVTCQLDGIAKVIFGATVQVGEDVGVDVNGKIVPAASTDWIIGVCREGGAVNEIGGVYLESKGVAA